MRPKLNLLIVEDEELDVIALQRAFARTHLVYPHTVARDGAEALSYLRADATTVEGMARPVLILLDINMPRMNGLEFLKELRRDQHLRQIPVFVLTTSDEQRDIGAAYGLGISGYVLKQHLGQNCERLITLINAYAELIRFPDA